MISHFFTRPFLLLLIPLYSFMTSYIAPKPPIFLSTFQKLIKPQSKEAAFFKRIRRSSSLGE